MTCVLTGIMGRLQGFQTGCGVADVCFCYTNLLYGSQESDTAIRCGRYDDKHVGRRARMSSFVSREWHVRYASTETAVALALVIRRLMIVAEIHTHGQFRATCGS